MRKPWPKLSEAPSLFGDKSPGACQQCGRTPGDVDLFRWREHDDADRPTSVVVVLCRECESIIEPHPRLYARLDPFEPHPGSMAICTNCRFRVGLACDHPNLLEKGGPGLKLIYPKPGVMFVDGVRNGRRFGAQILTYSAPAKCEVREPKDGAS